MGYSEELFFKLEVYFDFFLICDWMDDDKMFLFVSWLGKVFEVLVLLEEV